jgi:signal transduction histidine kinase
MRRRYAQRDLQAIACPVCVFVCAIIHVMTLAQQFFQDNLVFVYFFYGLAFFTLGLVVMLESGRHSEFRFARGLAPLAWFGLIHGAHEWLEMFEIFAGAQGAAPAGLFVETIRLGSLVASFLLLLNFGLRLAPGAEDRPRASLWLTLAIGVSWLAGVFIVTLPYRPNVEELYAAADVLARYALAIPGALLAALALLRERRDFHARGMSQYGGSLLWAALAFIVYGIVGQAFPRPSLVFPSQHINGALFIDTFGFPIQLIRALAAAGITFHLAKALRAFEAESRIRLARANKARIEAQAAALEAQQRRADEVEALNSELRAIAGELASLVDMSRILASTFDLKQMAGEALRHVVHSFPRACCAVVFLRRPDGGYELLRAYRRPEAPMPVVPPPVTEVCVRAGEVGGPVGARLDGPVEVLGPESFNEARGFRSFGAPLKSKDRTFGSLALSSVREEEPLGPDELRMLTAFAQQFATAIDNIRLYELVQAREAQLEDLVAKLVHAQEDERKRIARELHDDTGQKLSAMGMGLAALEAALASGNGGRGGAVLRNLREMNDQAISELRNIMADLRPAQLDDLGLVPALKWYVNQYQARNARPQVKLIVERAPGRLPPEHETVLFRVAQEALTNARRHAEAAEVTLRLFQSDDSVELAVQDDGVGFDPKQPPRHEPGSGLGLAGMRERVSLVSGMLQIESAPGQGTCIRVTLPLARKGE